MMFDIIINNKEKETFIKINDNKLEGFTIQKNIVSNIDKEELSILNLIKLGSNKTYLGKELEYDVYLDNESQLKHFFKDGKEDLEKFLNVNTTNAILYNDYNSDTESEVKAIKIKNIKIIIAKNILIPLLVGSLLGTIIFETGVYTVNKYIDYKVSQTESVDYDDLVGYIRENDNLSKKEKELFENEKLLKDIIPYYNDNSMKYLITLRLNDLKIVNYDKPKYNSIGYYNSLECNKLHIKNGYDDNRTEDTKIHEYIHLLQNPNDYSYIKEACAEIIKVEYYDGYKITAYQEEVNNIKILMETIGPEPIWKIVFSGDDTDFIAILNQNLASEKVDRLLELLKKKPKLTSSEEVRSILEELYFNMYNTYIRNDIFIDCIYTNTLISRYYFNSDKININNDSCWAFSKEKAYYTIKKQLSYEGYINYINGEEKPNEKLSYDIQMPKQNMSKDDIVSVDGIDYTLEEAIKMGIIKVYFTRKVNTLTDEQYLECITKGYTVEKDYVATLPVSENTTFEQLPNIYDKFPNQVIGLDDSLENGKNI